MVKEHDFRPLTWRYITLLLIAWTVLIGGLVTWEALDHRSLAIEDVAHEARMVFDRDQLIRRWASDHGGVYVPATEKTPPNPYLAHVPERDIVTPSGRKLTLLNPAYMMRQLNESAEEDFGVIGHITSLRPLRPENAPDGWEVGALGELAEGAPEVREIAVMGDRPFMRLMRPMETTADCLKCHVSQGYEVGVVSGGVSVSIPLEGIMAGYAHRVSHYSYFFGSIWVVGIIGILVVGRVLNRREVKRLTAEKKFRTMFDSSSEALVLFDGERFIDCNDATLCVFGCSTREELIGTSPLDWSPELQPDGRPSSEVADEMIRNATERGRCLFEWRHKSRDSREFPAEVLLTTMKIDGKTVFQATVRDITDRKMAEEALRRSEESLLEAQEIAHMGHWELDLITNKLKWSDEIYRIFGVEPDEFGATYEAFLNTVHPEDRDLVNHAFTESIENRTPYDIVHRLLLADGNVRYVNERCRTEYDHATGDPLRSLGTVIDITDMKRSEEKIMHMAYHDTLTGLPNRTLLIDRLNQVVSRKRRQHELAAVLFIDLDRFKFINDTIGHIKGDRVLVEVADRLRECTRGSDTVARQGGDEFTVVVQDIERMEDVEATARRFFSSLTAPVNVDGQDFPITISMGISVFPTDGQDADTLLKNADMAMFVAKESGRDSFRFYMPEMNEVLEARLRLERKLRKALAGSEFTLHYQPQVDVGTGEVVGVEALVRWQHPEDGIISPGDFIPVAEDTGLIVDIGEWVLRAACAQNRSWQDAGLKPVSVSVNVSFRQLRKKNFCAQVASALSDSGLDPRYLDLEITESMLMEDVEETLVILGELKRMGVSLSIDDFGTGYSSLAYLKRMPIDMLKVDRSFIMDITEDFDDVTITKATIQMAESLNLGVTAEGVETAEQLALLANLECDRAQGYLFSRPLPAEELERFLERGWRFEVVEEMLSDGLNSERPARGA